MTVGENYKWIRSLMSIDQGISNKTLSNELEDQSKLSCLSFDILNKQQASTASKLLTYNATWPWFACSKHYVNFIWLAFWLVKIYLLGWLIFQKRLWEYYESTKDNWVLPSVVLTACHIVVWGRKVQQWPALHAEYAIAQGQECFF